MGLAKAETMPMGSDQPSDSSQALATPEIWVGLVAEFDDERLSQAFHTILSDQERARTERYRHQRDRQLHLLARLMCRSVLSRYQPEVLPQQWQFQAGPHGKPELIGPKCNPGGALHFNLSHTEGVVVLAVSRDGEIGIDVERTDRPIDHTGLARRYFARVEAEAVENCPPAERGALFYRIWTLKEAYVKAVGKGLAHALDSFWFEPFETTDRHPQLQLLAGPDPDENAIPGWSAQVAQLDTAEPWVVSTVARTGHEIDHLAPWPIHKFQP